MILIENVCILNLESIIHPRIGIPRITAPLTDSHSGHQGITQRKKKREHLSLQSYPRNQGSSIGPFKKYALIEYESTIPFFRKKSWLSPIPFLPIYCF